MKSKNWLQQVLPEQLSGASGKTKTSRDFRNYGLARHCYIQAVERLLTVDQWHRYAGKGTARFKLFSDQGVVQDRPAKRGDYFCIDVPAPDNPDSNGSDWVQVQEIGEKKEGEFQLTWLTVRAALDPFKTGNTASHFFKQAATSTFIVYRDGITVMAAVYGRNEHPNTDSPNLLTRIRNLLLYLGARLGFSHLQWKALTKGLLTNS